MISAIAALKRPLLPHAGKRNGEPRCSATCLNRRSLDNVLDTHKKRYDSERSILCNASGKAGVRGQTFRVSLRSRKLIHGSQHQIVEIPAKGFE